MGNIGEIPCQRDVNALVGHPPKPGLFLHPRCLGDERSGSKRVYGISETGLATSVAAVIQERL